MRTLALLVAGVVCVLSLETKAAQDILLQAEDALDCPQLQLSDSNTAALKKLISDRRTMLSTVAPGTKGAAKITFFGASYSEPEQLIKWKASEDKAVRDILSASSVKEAEKYSQSIHDKISPVQKRFPYYPAIAMQINEKLPDAAGAPPYALEFIIEVDSPLYEIRMDKVNVTEEATQVYVSVIRPPDRLLLGKIIEKVSVKKVIPLTSVPRDIQIYSRSLVQDMPSNIKHYLISQLQPSIPPTPPAASTAQTGAAITPAAN